jgi:dihydroorotase
MAFSWKKPRAGARGSSLVREDVLTKPAAARKLSNDPARFVGVAGRSLEEGAPADLAIIDPEFGYNLSTDETGSKSKDSFFIGRRMKGKNQITIMGGRVVWQRDADHLGG